MRADHDDPPDAGFAELDARAQELVAVALTMMTRFSLEPGEAERAESAGIVVDALRELEQREELVPELRHLCGRLRRLWREAAR